MGGWSRRQAAALEELAEWWEDVATAGIGSQAVLLAVPPPWGRSAVLGQFTAAVEAADAVSLVVHITGTSPEDGPGVQAAVLRDRLAEAGKRHRVAELLGADQPAGAVQLGLATAGLLVSPLAAAGLLLAGIGVGAANRIWDGGPAGQEGALARSARAVAAESAAVPVLVVIDEADQIDRELAVTLVENLIERHDGQVLVVVAADPGSGLVRALRSRARYGLTEGRVQQVDADPSMGYTARVELAAELCPGLPDLAARQIGRRTQTFADVFAVTSAGRLADLDPGDEAAAVTAVDEVIDAQAATEPPVEAVVLAWAGGVLHARQAEQALAVLSAGPPGREDAVVRAGALVRLPGPVPAPLASKVRTWGRGRRHQLAAAVLTAAIEIGNDPGTGLVERVVAWQAAYRVRIDLEDPGPLLAVQCQLVRGLEALGDVAAAYQVADVALACCDDDYSPERAELSAAVLRLDQVGAAPPNDPVIETAVDFALAGGAAVGIEARVWAAVNLLGQLGRSGTALQLTDQVTAELGTRSDLGEISDQWRLLLAFHAGKAGYPALSQRLLTPMLDPDTPQRWDPAHAVLAAIAGPQADIRLQIVVLEAELQALPNDAADDDRLRLHYALSNAYARLGSYRPALSHAQQEFLLRLRSQGPEHPDTLATRSNIASWTGECGDAATALRLFRALLPDQQRALGPDHLFTLITRGNIASWTGESGDAATALRLFHELLPDRERVLGPDHEDTLIARGNIASWTGNCGDAATALRLSRALLPDQQRALGPDNPFTLITRGNIAGWTSNCGNAATALRLFHELLPDRQRVLGPDHPDTLITRNCIASLTAGCGDAATALRLSRALLPDQQRALGPDHPDTLTTRGNIAIWTGRCGDVVTALRLCHELLPDRERVLGPDHPDTLTTRSNIASLTGECGDAATALRLCQDLLPDEERVLGPDHPHTLALRSSIAVWTSESGDAATALRLFRALLLDRERVLGPDHPDTVDTRSNIAFLTGPGREEEGTGEPAG
jgi:hypothetical protein